MADELDDVVPDETGGESNEEVVQDPSTGKFIPIERFNEVYGKSKEYERSLSQYSGFGKPDELKSKLDKLSAWEKAVEEQRKTASMTDGDKAVAQRKLQIQKELYEIMPSLKLLEQIDVMEKRLAAAEGRTNEAAASAVLKDHSVSFAGILKTAKIDPKYQNKIEEYIVSQMDDNQKDAFVKGDFNVAKTIFDSELKDGLFSALKAKPALPVPALRNTPGGVGAKGEKKPMSLKEAEEAGFARINGSE